MAVGKAPRAWLSRRACLSRPESPFRVHRLRQRDDRAAARLCLERHDTEVLFSGKDHGGGPAVQLADLFVVRRPRNSTSRHPSACREARAIGSVPDDLSGTPASRRHRSRHRCVCRGPARTRSGSRSGTAAVRVEKLRIDRRINHSRLAIIVSSDPARNIMRIRHIAVDAPGRRGVPPRQPRHASRMTALPPGRDARARIRIELIPGVPHRRVAVADVLRAPRRRDRFGRAWLRAHDEIEAIEIEPLDRERKQRQVSAVVPAARPGAAARADAWIGSRSIRGDTVPATCTSVKMSAVGIALDQRLEHLLAAAHAGQPVVDQSDFASTAGPPRDPRRPRRFVEPARPTGPRKTPRARASPGARSARAARAPQNPVDAVRDRARVAGSTSTAASPADLRQRRHVEVTTGVPLAMASSGGRPNPRRVTETRRRAASR